MENGKLRYTDEELLAWGSEFALKPWKRILEVFKKLSFGERVSAYEALIPIPLTPFYADFRAIYPLFKELSSHLIADNPNLFTVILDQSEQNVLRGYIEETKEGVFVNISEQNVNLAWSKIVLEAKKSGDFSGIVMALNRDLNKRRISTQIGWVKIVNLGFFAPYKKAFELYKKTKEVFAYIIDLVTATKEVFEKGWINFVPSVPIFQRMREFFMDILDINQDHLRRSLEVDRYEEIGIHIALAIRSFDFTVGFSIKEIDPLYLTVNQDICERLKFVPFDHLASELRRECGAKVALAIAWEPLKELLIKALNSPLPWKIEDSDRFLRQVLYILRNFKGFWHISPVPFLLKDWILKLNELVRIPYDITHLAYNELPWMILWGGAHIAGWENSIGNIFMDKDRVKAVIIISHFDGGIVKISTFPPERLDPIFAGFYGDAKLLTERLEQAKEVIWKEKEWLAIAGAIQINIIRELFKMMASLNWRSIFTAPLLLPGIYRIAKEIKRGGVVVYPDLLLKKVHEWAKKEGRAGIIKNALQLLFDRVQPRERGVLYLKETIISAAILILIILLIVIF